MERVSPVLCSDPLHLPFARARAIAVVALGVSCAVCCPLCWGRVLRRAIDLGVSLGCSYDVSASFLQARPAIYSCPAPNPLILLKYP